MTRAFTPVPKPEPKRPAMRPGQQRRKYLRPRRFTKQQLGPDADEARLIWIRTEPCAQCGREPYQGHPNHACHEGLTSKGKGRKCIDAETFTLCPKCDHEWTAGQSTNGFARHWDKAKRREWAAEKIALATSKWLSHGNRRAA